MSYFQKLACFGIALLSQLSVVSCGGGSTGPTFSNDAAPKIHSSSVTPSTLVFTGGSVAVAANITDNKSVKSVDVVVSGPLGTNTSSATQIGDDWSVTLDLPVNENTNNQDDVYSVIIKAHDGSSNTTNSGSYTVTVVSMVRPPEPPTF